MQRASTPQEDWLLALLAREGQCDYLRRHGSPQSAQAFAAQVPLITHDALAPDIARMAAGEGDVLFMGQPVAWERTSGSSAAGGKLVPYSAAGLADMRAELGNWITGLADRHLRPGCAGQLYLALSPVLRAPQALAGVPIGLSDAAYLGDALAARLLPCLAVSPAVAGASDVASWRAQTVAQLRAARGLRMLSVWSPSFMLDLLDAMGEPDLPALWPDLALISCWTEAGAARDAAELQARLPHAQLQGKGLMATEGVVTVPNAQGQCVLAQRGFFEFLHEGQLHSPQALLPGLDYEVVMTTASGLYRYRTGDLVRLSAWAEPSWPPACQAAVHVSSATPSPTPLRHPQAQPVLRFMGRSGIQSDLVGEKLCEAFVSACLQGVPGACFLVPDAAARRYVLVAEQAINAAQLQAVARALCANPHYAYARSLGQLRELRTRHQPDLRARLAQATLANGGRLADTKTLGLRVHDAARWL